MVPKDVNFELLGTIQMTTQLMGLIRNVCISSIDRSHIVANVIDEKCQFCPRPSHVRHVCLLAKPIATPHIFFLFQCDLNFEKYCKDTQYFKLSISPIMLNTFSNLERDIERRLEREHHLREMENAASSPSCRLTNMDSLINQRRTGLSKYSDETSLGNLNLVNISITDLAEMEMDQKRYDDKKICINCLNGVRWMLNQTRKKYWIGGVGAFIFVVLSIFIFRENKSLYDSPVKFTLEDKTALVREWIVEVGLTSRDDLSTQGTAQNRALRWMIEEDEVTKKELISIERYILAVLYYSTNGWKHEDKWMSDESVCEWLGVQCNAKADIVESLNVTNNLIQGSLPSEITSLGGLKLLDLRGNEINGTIPENIGKMINLGENIKLHDSKIHR